MEGPPPPTAHDGERALEHDREKDTVGRIGGHVLSLRNKSHKLSRTGGERPSESRSDRHATPARHRDREIAKHGRTGAGPGPHDVNPGLFAHRDARKAAKDPAILSDALPRKVEHPEARRKRDTTLRRCERQEDRTERAEVDGVPDLVGVDNANAVFTRFDSEGLVSQRHRYSFESFLERHRGRDCEDFTVLQAILGLQCNHGEGGYIFS